MDTNESVFKDKEELYDKARDLHYKMGFEYGKKMAQRILPTILCGRVSDMEADHIMDEFEKKLGGLKIGEN